jgi:hypothetical protein
MLWWSFFSVLRPFDFRSCLGVEIQDFDVDSFHLQASPRIRFDIAYKRRFIVQVLRVIGFRLNFHAFCAAALIFGRESFRRC